MLRKMRSTTPLCCLTKHSFLTYLFALLFLKQAYSQFSSCSDIYVSNNSAISGLYRLDLLGNIELQCVFTDYNGTYTLALTLVKKIRVFESICHRIIPKSFVYIFID